MILTVHDYMLLVKVNTFAPINHLIVDFSIFSEEREPKDFQPFLDRLNALCKEFRYKHILNQKDKATGGGNKI